MTTVLDAYAVLALLKGEPAAVQVADLLTSDLALLPATGAAEVVDHLVRLVGVDEEVAMLDLAQLGLDPVAIDGRCATAAGALRAGHYHRTRRPVSLADCIAAQLAKNLGVALASADPPLLELCVAESIPVVPLVGSDGSAWSGPR